MAALDNASQIKISLIDDGQGLMAAPDDVAQVKVSLVGDGEQSIALVQSRGDGVALNGSAQPTLALAVPGVQGPSGTAFEEIPLNKLAPGTLPSGVSLGNALTFDDEGGASPGGTFNGGSPRTISYTSVGAAAAGHTHANLIFVPAGANDTALAAAFTDAAANGKRIVFAENTTVRIPSVAPTIQAACTLVMPTVDVTVLIESGETIDNKNVLRNGDYSRFRLASEDAEVLVGANLPGSLVGVVSCYNATAPEWDFLLDCDGKVDCGLSLFNSRGSLNAAKGVKRARRANAFVTQSSTLNANSTTGGIGAILSNSLEHGIWVTWSSSLSGHFLDLRNNGASGAGFGAFISRGCHIQLDRCNMSGSANGIRCARSIVSARQSDYSNIPGTAVLQFEEGFVNAAFSTYNGSGGPDAPVLQVGVGTNGRAQGGGVICAENSTFNNVGGTIANVIGARGVINIDNSNGTGLQRQVAVVSNGAVSCIASSFAVSASNTLNELFLGSRNSTITCFAGTMDGGNSVRNLGRFIENGVGVFDRTVSVNFAENVLCRVSEAGQVYANGATHNGSANPMNRGANVRGEFVRHVNGQLECWAWLEVTELVNSKLMTRAWDFPVSFSGDVNTIVVTATLSRRGPDNVSIPNSRDKLRDCQIISDAVSASESGFRIEINSSSSQEFVAGNNFWIRAHAIGRWF
jgi:hypothetical protein